MVATSSSSGVREVELAVRVGVERGQLLADPAGPAHERQPGLAGGRGRGRGGGEDHPASVRGPFDRPPGRPSTGRVTVYQPGRPGPTIPHSTGVGAGARSRDRGGIVMVAGARPKAASSARPVPERRPEFSHLTLDGLRAYRRALTAEESRVSYWRRLIQARLDVVADTDAVTDPAVARAHPDRLRRVARRRAGRPWWPSCRSTTCRRCPTWKGLWARELRPDDAAPHGQAASRARPRRAAAVRVPAAPCTASWPRPPRSSSPGTARTPAWP